MKVLVADPIAKEGIAKLQVEAAVDVVTGLAPGDLIKCIPEYDALVVRSETKVTAEVIEAGRNLKIIGRAGVGVDNIDVPAATARGIVVVNSPGGNTIAATEHAMALLLSLSRNIPQANSSLKEGKWNRSAFTGVQVMGKTLGVIGLGRIGGEVARRAQGFKMQVLAYDPFLSSEGATQQGVRLVTLDELIRTSDYITVHVPLVAETRHMIGERELAAMKKGVRIINAARGGIVDEVALCAAIKTGQVAGAALDVFETEPLPSDSPLLGLPSIVVTPHLGASTNEAQVNVAVEVAEGVLAALRGEYVQNAVNLPSVPKEVLRQIEPYVVLVDRIGRLLGNLVDGAIQKLEVTYSGEVAGTHTALITLSLLKGLLTPQMSGEINLVSAPLLAKRRGINVLEQTTPGAEGFGSLITARASTSTGSRLVAGTLFGELEPRIVRVDDYRVDFEPFGYNIIQWHEDKPGMIGKIGTILGRNNINIAGLHLGRKTRGGRAIVILSVDDRVPPPVLRDILDVGGIFDLRFVDLGFDLSHPEL